MTQIQLIDIDQLTLLEHNPRSITKSQMEKLKKSISQDPDFLQCRPILVNVERNGEYDGAWIVYAGNQRVRAAKELGWSKVPCIVEFGLSDKVMRKRIIVDNKTMGNWDYDELMNFDTDLLLDAGFLEIELTGPTDTESEPEKKEKKKKEKICPHCLMPL